MNQDFFSSINNKRCHDKIGKNYNYKSKCHGNDTNCNPCYRCCYVVGPTGPTGPQGIQGETGPSGGILNYADFYALMPPDNAATVAPGADVSFPQDGPNSGVSITRTGVNSFNLSEIGIYQIYFNVPVSEAGQLQLTINGGPLAYTVVGRATGTSDISGMFLVETTTIDSILTVRNPAGSAAALTITPLAGGANSVSAHLVIIQIA